MVQLMPQPFKHPKTGVFYYRKVVPVHLRNALGGKTEFRISLGTKNLAEAKRLYLDKAADVEAKLSAAAGGPVSLSVKHIAALAGKWYREMTTQYDEHPGDELGWDEWHHELRDAYHSEGGDLNKLLGPIVDTLLKEEGIVVDQRSRDELQEMVLTNALQLVETQTRKARGDYSPDAHLPTIPEWTPPGGDSPPPKECLTVEGLLKDWAKDRKPSERTVYGWTRILKKLTTYVGFDDPRKLTKTNIIGWRDALLNSKLAPKTVRNHVIIAATLFSWAVKNEKLLSNPAQGVEVSVKRHPSERRLPFSNDEAERLLQDARNERGARRWLPWLLAFSGARLEEICQSFVSDIRKLDDIWHIDINADHPSKTLKNAGAVRKVPLHPALIEEGFLDYVQSLPNEGPLFPDLKPDRFGRRGGNGTKIIGRWVRERIADRRKPPNHAWRHWFKDQCRAVRMEKAVNDALTGHASSDVGDGYGLGYPLTVLAEAIAKLRNPLAGPEVEATGKVGTADQGTSAPLQTASYESNQPHR